LNYIILSFTYDCSLRGAGKDFSWKKVVNLFTRVDCFVELELNLVKNLIVFPSLFTLFKHLNMPYIHHILRVKWYKHLFFN
jgi:hypothetical protein